MDPVNPETAPAVLRPGGHSAIGNEAPAEPAPPEHDEAVAPTAATPEGSGADFFVDGVDTAHEAPGGRHVVRGSVWFIASVVFGAGFGMLFWVITARRTEQYVFGVANALWTLVQFVNYATSMGLPVAVAKYGSGRPRTVNSLFLWALLYTAFSSLAGALVLVLVAPSFLQEEVRDSLFRFGPVGGVLLFFLLVSGMSYAVLVEVRLVTLRMWGWVFGRQVAIGLIRLPFLYLAVVARSPLAILLLIAGTPALSGFVGAVALRYATPPADRGRLRPLPAQIVPAFRFASVNYLGMLAAQAPQFAVPLVVLSIVGATQLAAFYPAWLISTVVFIVPHTIGQVVLSESGKGGARRAHQVRTGLKLSLAATAAATVVAVLTAPLMPKIFGPDYDQARVLLPRLVGASIPWAVTAILLARARVEAHHARTVVITLAFAGLTLIPVTVMTGRAGIDGTATAWLVGNLLAAPVALLATRFMKQRARTDLVPSPARL